MSVQESCLPYTRIPPDDNEAIARFARIITTAFDPSPLFNAFATEQDNVPPPYPAQFSFSRRLLHFEPGITLLAKNGAILVESGDWSAVAMWLPPDYAGPSFGQARKYNSSLTDELREKLTQAEHRLFNTANEDVEAISNMQLKYELAFLARNPDRSPVLGAISAVVRPFLKRAEELNVPVCLDAMNINGVEVYKHYGFRMVEEVRIGVARNDENGWPKEGGIGVSVWVMIYDDHLKGLPR